MTRLIAVLALTAWIAISYAWAEPFCRSPEAIISAYDHRGIEAEFFPLYGAVAINAIGRLNELLPGSGIEGDAVLVAAPTGELVIYAYLFKSNCHIRSAWIRATLFDDIIGGGV